MTYAFGEIELDPDRRELRLAGDVIALEPQAFDVLVHLVLHRDRVVAKEELMDTVWGGRFVSEAAVTSRIKQVRRALGDDGHAQTFVRTYHGRGYRFVAEVRDGPSSSAGSRTVTAWSPTTDFHPHEGRSPVLSGRRGDLDVRFQLTGQGPPDVLFWPPVDDLDAEWGDPQTSALLTALGGLGRLIRAERSTPPLRDWRAVLDAAASERAVVFSQGVPATPVLELVASDPGRCAAVVFFGSAPGPEPVTTEKLSSLPTLVLHRTGDPVVDVSQGRRLAALLPEAEFRALPGRAHAAAADVEQVVEAVRDLLEDQAAHEAARRSLASLVGLAGDDLTSLTEVLVGLGGRERRGPEDAVIVSFDGPANAFRALGSRRARGLVDEVGVGVAIDDVSRDSLLVSGHGVDVARLFARLAAPGEVLFPNVIKDLLASSGLSSEPLPPVDLAHVGPHPVHRWQRR